MSLKEAPTDEHPGRAIPHNPCINAGAIMAVSMVYPGVEERSERLDKVVGFWKDLSGGEDAPIGYDDATYKSESATADRNWCLGFMMREKKSWPPCFSYDGTKSLSDTLELYFQICFQNIAELKLLEAIHNKQLYRIVSPTDTADC